MHYSEHKAIASSFYESYNRKDIEESFANFIATDLVNHTMSGSLDRDKWLAFEKNLLAACPDLQLTVKEQFVEGNRVVTHWNCYGTHTADFMGMAPSGNPVHLTGVSIDSIENGKIKEHFTLADFTQFIQQFSKKY
jgi:steroid delta-isomerase-like uncharacterized protein